MHLPNQDTAALVIGLLASVLLLCLGLLVGYLLGKQHRGDLYRAAIRELTEEARLWKHAFWDVHEKVLAHHRSLFSPSPKCPAPSPNNESQ